MPVYCLFMNTYFVAEIFSLLIEPQNRPVLPMILPLGRDGAFLVICKHNGEPLLSGAVLIDIIVGASMLVLG